MWKLIKAQLTIPNIITIIRLLCIPWLAAEIYRTRGYSLLSGILYIAIWFTDYIDGYIARKYDQVSDLGKMLDPFVDKLFHLVTAIMMTVVGRIPAWFPIAFVVKEVLMVLGAVALVKNKLIMSAKWYGKVSTVVVAAAFALVFIIPERYDWVNEYLFIIPTVTIYYSLFAYAYQIYYVIKNDLLKKIKPNEEGFRDISQVKIA